jgi:hypothetical protein
LGLGQRCAFDFAGVVTAQAMYGAGSGEKLPFGSSEFYRATPL